MLTTFLYFFTFSSWGLGLLAALSALSMKLQAHSAEMKSQALELESDTIEVTSKKAFIEKMSGMGKPPSASRIPDELAKLISNSPGHPEVNEIDGDDEVYGVVFQAHSYPPSMDDDNDNDE
jgi:hypothetical protein